MHTEIDYSILTPQQNKIIAATLLGDGSLFTRKSRHTVQFYIELVETSEEYVNYMYILLHKIFGGKVSKRSLEGKPHPQIRGRDIISKPKVRYRTNSHSVLIDLRSIWYPGGKKIVPDYVYDLIDFEFLAHWYQQDGHIVVDKRFPGDKKYREMKLCTNSFTNDEVNNLIMALKSRLTLENVKLHKDRDKPIIYFSRKETDKILPELIPYMSKCFYYKLGKFNPERNNV